MRAKKGRAKETRYKRKADSSRKERAMAQRSSAKGAFGMTDFWLGGDVE
jgi:hypothetical protein